MFIGTFIRHSVHSRMTIFIISLFYSSDIDKQNEQNHCQVMCLLFAFKISKN